MATLALPHLAPDAHGSSPLEVETLTPNPVRLDLIRDDLRSALHLFRGTAMSDEISTVERFVVRDMDVDDENRRITLHNAAKTIEKLLTALTKNNDSLLPDDFAGWMPQISMAFWIKESPARPEVTELRFRVVQALKDLDLIPQNYGRQITDNERFS